MKFTRLDGLPNWRWFFRWNAGYWFVLVVSLEATHTHTHIQIYTQSKKKPFRFLAQLCLAQYVKPNEDKFKKIHNAIVFHIWRQCKWKFSEWTGLWGGKLDFPVQGCNRHHRAQLLNLISNRLLKKAFNKVLLFKRVRISTPVENFSGKIMSFRYHPEEPLKILF